MPEKNVLALYRKYMDASAPQVSLRWCVAAMLTLLYICRIAMAGGFHVVTYVLAIRLLVSGVEVITPSQPICTTLPTSNDDVQPFVPKKAEFVAWKECCASLIVAFFCTFIRILDIPVFWPILVVYVLLLFFVQFNAEINKMIRYRYVPWNTGKKRKFVKRAADSSV